MKNENKVCCEYCDSYVDINENETCPNCGGSLKDAVLKEKTRQRIEEIDKAERQKQAEKEEREAKDTDEVFDLIKTLAGSALGAGIIGSVAKAAGRAAGDFIKEDMRQAFKKRR